MECIEELPFVATKLCLRLFWPVGALFAENWLGDQVGGKVIAGAAEALKGRGVFG
jgi:hypothetical protein